MNDFLIKAVIFDVDGTMVDSEPLHVRAWNDALGESGHSLSDLPENFRATMAGRKPIAIATGMTEELNLSITPVRLLASKTAKFLDLVSKDLQGMPGIVESINRLDDASFKLAIGTSLDNEYIKLVLEKLNVKSFFPVIVTGDEIKNGKPHPETYQKVVERLGLRPNETVVLEDAKSGIEAAKAAGCYCIAVDNPNALPQDTSQADKVVSSLEEVTSDLIQGLSRPQRHHPPIAT